MKKALVLFLLLILASAASAQTWFQGTVDQAVAKAKSENKLVLVDFFSGG
jgi:Skp family chaperone for outer membrane proteins